MDKISEPHFDSDRAQQGDDWHILAVPGLLQRVAKGSAIDDSKRARHHVSADMEEAAPVLADSHSRTPRNKSFSVSI